MLFGDRLPFFGITVLEFVIDDRHLKHISTGTIIISNNIIHWFYCIDSPFYPKVDPVGDNGGNCYPFSSDKTGYNICPIKYSNMHVISAFFNTELTSTNISLI